MSLAKTDRGSAAQLQPKAVDARIRGTPLTLEELRCSFPKECLEHRPGRGWPTLLRVLASMGACVAILALVKLGPGPGLLWRIPALASAWIIYGWVLLGLFVIGHECGHLTFAKTKWANSLVGHICLSVFANNYRAWTVTHDHHHTYTQLRGQEVDWSAQLLTRQEYKSPRSRKSLLVRLGYALPFGILLWVGWNAVRRVFSVRSLMPADAYASERWRLFGSSVVLVSIVAAIYALLWHFLGTWGVLKYNVIPVAIATLTGWMILVLQHAGEGAILYSEAGWEPVRGQVVSTFDIRFPRVLEFLWCNINIHIPHHLHPGVPWYRLSAAGTAIRLQHPYLYQQRGFKLRQIAWLARTPFLHEVEDMGYFLFE